MIHCVKCCTKVHTYNQDRFVLVHCSKNVIVHTLHRCFSWVVLLVRWLHDIIKIIDSHMCCHLTIYYFFMSFDMYARLDIERTFFNISTSSWIVFTSGSRLVYICISYTCNICVNTCNIHDIYPTHVSYVQNYMCNTGVYSAHGLHV